MIEEDIEGFETTENYGWAEYPLDSVFVRREDRSVSEAVKRIRNNRYQLDPDFQRDFVWSVEKQSKLIESCLMRIPLPVFYVAEAKDGRIIVVDGLQRLTTLHRYIENSFTLRGLASEVTKASPHPLEGKKFRDLPLNFQERIEDTQLVFYILDAKAPERARLDIFDRVNSGVPLSRQQMRNSLYNGPATRWLKTAAESKVFLQATGGSLDSKTMRDREAINRFCAFKILKYDSYKGGDMEGFLGRALEVMNRMKQEELDELRSNFDNSMQMNFKLFGPHTFRKSLREDDAGAKRSIMNIALFDVFSEYFSDVQGEFTTKQKKQVRDLIINLLYDDDFNLSITYSTNSTNAIQTRFQMVEDGLGEFFK